MKCKKCSSKKFVKNGKVGGRQRYKCKECGYNFREGDDRVKHGMDVRIRALKYYFEGSGIRSIARNEGVSAPTVIEWIRDAASIIRQKLLQAKIPEDAKKIQIIEIDELFSFVQKKLQKSTYGLTPIKSLLSFL